MSKLCFVLAIFGLLVAFAAAQGFGGTFQSRPQNYYRPNYNRLLYDREFQKNFQRRNQLLHQRQDIYSGAAGILNQRYAPPVDGSYEYIYETDNGIRASQRGSLRSSYTGEPAEVVDGYYSFVTPEGLQVLVEYTADENGYHPRLTYGGPGSLELSSAPKPADVNVA